jgi:hypothetical protein
MNSSAYLEEIVVIEHSIFQRLLNQEPLLQQELNLIIQKNGLVIKSARLRNLLGLVSRQMFQLNIAAIQRLDAMCRSRRSDRYASYLS